MAALAPFHMYSHLIIVFFLGAHIILNIHLINFTITKVALCTSAATILFLNIPVDTLERLEKRYIFENLAYAKLNILLF